MRTSHWPRIHTPARAESGLPRPAHATLPYAAILAWTGTLTVAHVLGARWAIALAGSSVIAGAGAWAFTAAALMRLRDRADRLIATGAGGALPAEVIEQRRAELLGRHERRMLAATLRRSVASAEAPPIRSARVPLDRRAVLAERARVEQLADLLADTDVAVSAPGVARTCLLVTDAGSPLYRMTKDGPDELHQYLVQTLFELEAKRPQMDAQGGVDR
jgi:hypothetical protein